MRLRTAAASLSVPLPERRSASSRRVPERLDRAPPAKHERIGNELERREINVALTRRGKRDEAPVEPGIFALARIDHLLGSSRQSRPARGDRDGPAVRIEVDIPALRAALAEIEFSLDRQSLRIAQRKR